MKLIIDNQCTYMKEVDYLDQKIEKVLNAILDKVNVSSLTKIIITSADDAEYREAVRYYSVEIDEETNVTVGDYVGVAVTIRGINQNGELEQIIFMRESIYLYLKRYFFEKNDKETTCELEQQAYEILIHEIGHSIDEEYRYRKYEDIPVAKEYNLEFELEEYSIYEMLQLWSEYFAQRFVYILCENPSLVSDGEIKKNMEYIENDNFLEKNNQMYRCLYYFAHYMAYYHHNKQELPLLNQENLIKVTDILKEIEMKFKQLYDKYLEWDYNEVKQSFATLYAKLLYVDIKN